MPVNQAEGAAPGNWVPSQGMNLAGLSDWSPELPFVDIFKTARGWITQIYNTGNWEDNDWDTEESSLLELDENGWPIRLPAAGDGAQYDSIGTLMLRDMAGDFPGGIYHVFYEGEGSLHFGLGATVVSMEDGHVVLEVDATSDGGIYMRIDETDPNSSGDYLRNFHVVHEDQLELFEAGVTFNPAFVETIQDMAVLRYMVWQNTNDETWNTTDGFETSWQTRSTPDSATWAAKGAPIEVMVELASLTGTDMWVNIPHNADDTYVRQMAELIHDSLRSDLKVYVEYSNEVWNWGFEQSHYAVEQAEAMFGGEVAGGYMQHYGVRSMQVIEIFEEAFGARSDDVLGVFGTQWGWLGLEQYGLHAEDWVAQGGVAPIESGAFDIYAVGAYFGGNIGNQANEETIREWMAMGDAGLDLAYQELATGGLLADGDESLLTWRSRVDYHHEVAEANGLRLAAYEGGQHIVGDFNTRWTDELREYYQAIVDDLRMADIYQDMMDYWRDAGGTLFTQFLDIDPAGPHGSWGVRYNLQENTPRSDFIDGFNAENPMWWDNGRSAGDFDGASFATGTAGDDSLEGTSFNDALRGMAGDDLLSGMAGDDVLVGGGGSDTLDGGDGDDYLAAETGTVIGGVGDDTLRLSHAFSDYQVGSDGDALILTRGDEILRLFGVETIVDGSGLLSEVPRPTPMPTGIIGTDNDDRLKGTDDDELIEGLGGNDFLLGGGGSDTLDGGDGWGDTAAYWNAASGVYIDLAAGGALDDGDGSSDIIRNVDAVHGSSHDDILLGDDNGQQLLGLGGNDEIDGRGGNDWLAGKDGDDTLTGGAGEDTFYFFTGHAGHHTITDFTEGEDQLRISGMSEAEVHGEATAAEGGVLIDLGDQTIFLVGIDLTGFLNTDIYWWE